MGPVYFVKLTNLTPFTMMTTQVTIPENALQPVEIPAFSALAIACRATLTTLAENAVPADLRLRQEAARLGIAGQPTQWIYTGVNGDETNEFLVEVTLPVAHLAVEPPTRTVFKTFPSFRAMRYTYTGSWADFGEVYDQLFAQLYRAGYRNDGHVREVYQVVDAETPENCVTEIQIGLA